MADSDAGVVALEIACKMLETLIKSGAISRPDARELLSTVVGQFERERRPGPAKIAKDQLCSLKKWFPPEHD